MLALFLLLFINKEIWNIKPEIKPNNNIKSAMFVAADLSEWEKEIGIQFITQNFALVLLVLSNNWEYDGATWSLSIVLLKTPKKTNISKNCMNHDFFKNNL